MLESFFNLVVQNGVWDVNLLQLDLWTKHPYPKLSKSK